MKIVFLDHTHEIMYSLFQNKNWIIDFKIIENKEELKKIIHQYDGIIIRSRLVLDEQLLSFATNLKFIGRPGSGLENINLEYCEKNNIEVFRSPEGNANAVAEHIIGLLYSFMNNIHKANNELKLGIWNRKANWGEEIENKIFGIYGFGVIGQKVAEKLKGLNIKLIVYDKYKSGFGDEYIEEVTENEFFERCDIFSLHTPLTKETIGLVNKEFINKFRKKIYIINTARGKSLILKDLVEAIENGKVIKAALDVIETENIDFENNYELDNSDIKYLLNSDKVIITPHIAGWTRQSNILISEILAHKIIDYFTS